MRFKIIKAILATKGENENWNVSDATGTARGRLKIIKTDNGKLLVFYDCNTGNPTYMNHKTVTCLS